MNDAPTPKRHTADRREHGGAGLGPILSPIGDDPESWTVFIGRVGGLRIGLHVLLILFVASEMFRAVFHIGGEATNTIGIVATAMAGLAIAALVHETGRALITRWSGGEATAIVLWPLGGMATHRLPSSTRHRLIASVGGLAASISLACVLWPVLLNMTPNWYSVLVDPVHPSAVFSEWVLVRGGAPAWWMSLLWWTGFGNIVMICANVLPVYPLDSATIVEVGACRLLGRRTGMGLAITLALAICLALLLAGLMTNHVMVVFLAGFGWMCGTRRARQSSFLEGEDLDDWSGPGQDASLAEDAALLDLGDEMAAMEEGVKRAPRSLSSLETDTFVIDGGARSETETATTAENEAEMDRILAKISRTGVSSLTDPEKRTLKLMTARRRRRQ